MKEGYFSLVENPASLSASTSVVCVRSYEIFFKLVKSINNKKVRLEHTLLDVCS